MNGLQIHAGSTQDILYISLIKLTQRLGKCCVGLAHASVIRGVLVFTSAYKDAYRDLYIPVTRRLNVF